MKLLKKIVAITLAGVLTMALLTGCASTTAQKPVDKNAELIAAMNDSLRSPMTKGLNREEVREYKADPATNDVARAAAEMLTAQAKTEAALKTFWEDNLWDTAEMRAKFIKADDHNIYQIAYVKNVTYSSTIFKALEQIGKLKELNDHMCNIYPEDYYQVASDVTALVGIADLKLDEDVYTIVVIQYPAMRVEG